jgi:hypothetical protein
MLKRAGEEAGLPTEVTLVWFSLDTVVIAGVAVFIAGILIGLCCGPLRHTRGEHHPQGSSSFSSPHRPDAA